MSACDYTVFGDLQSGNCYKIKLLMQLLDIPHQWTHVEVLKGETSTADFKLKNPVGRIPVLQIGTSQYLSESNAILNFLADKSIFLPEDAFARAKVLQWQFFEQYSHEPYIAVARFINKFLGLPANRREEYESKQEGGNRALQVMDDHLQSNRFFVGDSPSIADISLFSYSHVAGEGGFDLSRYPAVNQWIDRIIELPGFYAMPGVDLDVR